MKLARIILCVLLCLCLAGCEYTVVGGIDGYGVFLNDYTVYKDYGAESEEPPEPIKGFVALSNRRFDYGSPFCGGCAYVEKYGKNFVLGFDGALREIEENLRGVEITDGKYIYTDNGKCGVKDVFGSPVVSAEYDSAEIEGETVLARNGNVSSVFRFGELYARAQASGVAYLTDEYSVYFGGRICGLDLLPLTAGGGYYIGIPREGIAAVSFDGGGAGYVDLSSGKRVGDEYREVTEFSHGEAFAVTFDGLNIVIDAKGDILYSSRVNKVCAFNGKYRCYVRHNGYGVMDSEFTEITDAVFSAIKYERAFGDYIIVGSDAGPRLYSIAENGYTEVYGDDIEVLGETFAVRRGNKTVLLDFELDTLFECDGAWYSDGVLTVEKEGEYFYYLDTF